MNFNNNHWALCAIDMRKKRITFYDSLGKDALRELTEVYYWIKQEMTEKWKIEFKPHEWSLRTAICPQQKDGTSCGVFMCKFAESLSRDAPLSTRHEDIPKIRRVMIAEMLTGQLESVTENVR